MNFATTVVADNLLAAVIAVIAIASAVLVESGSTTSSVKLERVEIIASSAQGQLSHQ